MIPIVLVASFNVQIIRKAERQRRGGKRKKAMTKGKGRKANGTGKDSKEYTFYKTLTKF